MSRLSLWILAWLSVTELFAATTMVCAEDAQSLSDGQIIERAKSTWESGASAPALELLAQGIEPASGGVEEFSGYFNAEVRKWAKVIKDAAIPPQ